MKFKIIILMILIFTVAGAVILFNTQVNQPYALVDMILSHVDAGGTLVDWHNDIGVESIDDIGYKVGDKGVYYLNFGKVEIELTPELLVDKKMRDKLEKCGIKVYKDKEGNPLFKYHGEEIEQWVR